MSLNAIQAYADNLLNDVYTLDDQNSVIIGCQNRYPETVTGYLASPFAFDVTAEYQKYGDLPNLSSILGVLDAGANIIAGMTMQQPWFGRKYWKGTNPITFAIKVAFIATSDAKTDVYDKVETLVGYLYPRKLTSSTANGVHLYVPPGPNLFTYADEDGVKQGSLVNTLNNSSILQTLGVSNAVQNFTAKLQLDKGGPDSHSIRVGSMMDLKVCYLDKVGVQFSQTLDSRGYPHYALCTISVSAFDSSFADERGVFSLKQTTALNCNLSGILEGAKATLTGE